MCSLLLACCYLVAHIVGFAEGERKPSEDVKRSGVEKRQSERSQCDG
jgi:hypothetical protein